MNWRDLFTKPVWGLAVAALACAGAYFFSGPSGLAGMSLGLFGTAFNMWALGRVVSLLGSAGTEDAPAKLGATLTVLAFLVKLPLLIGLGFFAQQIGGGAMPCFLAGLGLVYFATVGWAQAKT